ncbi:hypothetical protein TNCV_884591 [Trichonephila clavipes]|nr:hypothetical protein TNCV_884591 [Trichonephila clavipes]
MTYELASYPPKTLHPNKVKTLSFVSDLTCMRFVVNNSRITLDGAVGTGVLPFQTKYILRELVSLFSEAPHIGGLPITASDFDAQFPLQRDAKLYLGIKFCR